MKVLLLIIISIISSAFAGGIACRLQSDMQFAYLKLDYKTMQANLSVQSKISSMLKFKANSKMKCVTIKSEKDCPHSTPFERSLFQNKCKDIKTPILTCYTDADKGESTTYSPAYREPDDFLAGVKEGSKGVIYFSVNLKKSGNKYLIEDTGDLIIQYYRLNKDNSLDNHGFNLFREVWANNIDCNPLVSENKKPINRIQNSALQTHWATRQ